MQRFIEINTFILLHNITAHSVVVIQIRELSVNFLMSHYAFLHVPEIHKDLYYIFFDDFEDCCYCNIHDLFLTK